MASVTERRILDASRHFAGPDKVPALRPAYVRATRMHVDGFSRAQRDAAIWRVPMVMGALQQMLSEVDWGELHRHAARQGQCAVDDGQQVPLALTKASTCSRRSLRRCSASSRT